MSLDPVQNSNDLHADWRPAHSPWIIAVTVMIATFMEVLDTSIANVALPHIAGNLSASIDESTWVLTSYLVANAIILPLSGWFSMLFGRKRFYIACVAMFTITSLLCGLAPNIETLVLFRILQGASGGALQPISQSILVESFEPKRRGMAMAVYGMGIVFAPIIGPTLGGWITDNYSWRWIFLINIPVGFLSIALTGMLIKDPPFLIRKTFKTGLKIDFIGLGLLSVGLGALQIMLDKGQREDWFASQFINSLAIIAVVCLIAVVIWELRHSQPVVDLKLLKDRNFSAAVFMIFFVGFVLYGSTVLLPIYLQTLLGYNATLSGLVLSPGGIVTLCTMPIVGLLLSKVQARWLVIVGLVIGAIGLFESTRFSLQTSFAHAVWARIIISASLGFLFVPINSVAYHFLAKTQYDQASGLVNLSRNLGGSFGISFVTTILARRTQFHQARLTDHVNDYNPAYREMSANAHDAIIAQGTNAYTAAMQAKSLIYSLVQREAAMLSFIDAFWLLGILFLAIIPLVFVMRSTANEKVHVQGH